MMCDFHTKMRVISMQLYAHKNMRGFHTLSFHTIKTRGFHTL